VGSDVFGPTVLLLDGVEHDPTTFGKMNFSQMVLIPALSGRLLRFRGDIMHAVPRPPLAYLDPEVITFIYIFSYTYVA
jgi:hypothetical protein